MYSALFLAQIRHTVGYLVIPTRTGLRSAKMSEQQTTRPRHARSMVHGTRTILSMLDRIIRVYDRTLVVVFPVTSLLVIKMAWNGKHPLESASRSLLENFESFAYACL